MFRTYYVAMEFYEGNVLTKAWRIINTDADLETVDGVLQLINDFEEKEEKNVWICNWKQLQSPSLSVQKRLKVQNDG